MYKCIFMPVDGSEVSNHAAEEGFRLAKALGSEAVLQYVIDISIVTLPDAELAISSLDIIRDSFREQGEKVLKDLSDKAREMGVPCSTMMSEGDVHDEIIKAAEEMKADLIIIGTHGRRGLNRLILGSVAGSVAKRAHCPVLLIRPT